MVLVLLRLPLRTRLRCREVSLRWRDCLADTQLWRVFEQLAEGDAKLTEAMLRAVSALAKGELRVLDVSSVDVLDPAALLDVVHANSASLLELNVPWLAFPAGDEAEESGGDSNVGAILHVLQAAPKLRLLRCDATCTPSDALRILSNQPPFGAVQLHEVGVSGLVGAANFPCDVPLVMAAAKAHESLKSLRAYAFSLHAASDLFALVDVAIARSLRGLFLHSVELGPASLPALALLLREAVHFRELDLCNMDEPFMTGEGLGPFCAALRCSQLSDLCIRWAFMYDSLADGRAVIAALAGHATLTHVDLFSAGYVEPEWQKAIGRALSRLISARSLLVNLHLGSSNLGEDGLRPIFSALAGPSARLRIFGCPREGIESEAFAEAVLLPAVRANTSLRRLSLHENDASAELERLLQEATELVKARPGGEGAQRT